MTVSLHGLDLAFLQNEPPIVRERKPRVSRSSKRSHLACPHIKLDRVEYRSHIDGTMITSGAQHVEHLKRHGYVELGTEDPRKIDKEKKKEARAKRKESVKASVRSSIKKYEEGFRNPPVRHADAHVSTHGVTRGEVVKEPTIII